MASSSSQQADKIVNVNTELMKHVTINHNYSTPSTHAPKRNPVNNIELAVDTFIGRETELGDIMQRFHHYPIVVIAAMGGMGKTQLARKFASVNADVYRDRYWINAETTEQLLKSFDRLAEKVKVKASTDIDTVRDTYRTFTEGAALLILDNVEHVNNVYEYFPSRIQLEDITLHVLVTSRWTEWTSDPSVNYYQLQPLNISVSLELFQRKFSETCIETMRDEWEELARMLGYLPLALQVATSYIDKRTKYNSDLRKVLVDYIKLMKEGADGLLNDPLIGYGNRSVYTSMMVTLEQFETKADNESNVQWKLAVTLINLIAYMNPDYIEKEILLEFVDNPENICKLDEALAILTEYSLINQGVDRGVDTIYSIHRIIQSCIRHNQSLTGTADTYYIRVLKYAFAEDYFHKDELRYVNERASAVAEYYNNNPSPAILEYLIKYNAIPAMEAVLKLLSNCKNQAQIAIKEHDLLYRAVEDGHLNMVQLLCKYGAGTNQKYDLGKWAKPPLHHALHDGNLEIATWLLENGATLTLRDGLGCNALHAAIMFNMHKMVPIIIQKDGAVVNETNNDGQTPLHVIEYHDNEKEILSTIHVLVKSGADITAVDEDGNTVLHSVTRSACAAAVSFILQRNTDLIDNVNKHGETALHVIPYYEDTHGTYVDDARILSTMRVHVQSGADLTMVDTEGNTVLHLAARYACVAAVTFILQRNNDLINIVNNHGDTALHAISYDKLDMDEERIISTMCVLLRSGANLTKVDTWSGTVIHSAARGARAELVTFVLQRNNDLINIKNYFGRTALHVVGSDFYMYIPKEIFAAVRKTARVLIMNGLSLDTRDNEGCTPLDTVQPQFKDILRQVADECQLLVRPVKRQSI